LINQKNKEARGRVFFDVLSTFVNILNVTVCYVLMARAFALLLILRARFLPNTSSKITRITSSGAGGSYASRYALRMVLRLSDPFGLPRPAG
jgi:hypothetical protein